MNRYKDTKIASLLGIFGNVFLFVIKIIIALITYNVGMLADSFNSAGDILSSVITYIGNKISSKPNDEDHNMGHGKAEYIFSMLLSLIMMFTSFVLFKTSIDSIIFGKKYIFSIWLIIISIITIITKLLLFLYTRKIAKKHKNLLLNANSKDHRNDIFITSANLISILLSLINIYYLDGFIGLFITLWIFITSIKIFKNSYDVLMDKAIDDDTKNKVLKIVSKYEEIKKIQHFNSTPVGYKYQISLTIFVDGNLSTFKSHEIADKLEKEIIKSCDEIYLAIIHVNPI